MHDKRPSVNQLIAELVQARRRLRQVTQQHYTPALQAIGRAEAALYGLLQRHTLPPAAIPTALCLRCLARAEAAYWEGEPYMRCIVCQDVQYLGHGVELLVGILDAHTQPLQPHSIAGPRVEAPVWNHETQQPMPMLPEILHIVGGQALDYDGLLQALALQWGSRAGHSPPLQRVVLLHQPDIDYTTLTKLRMLAAGRIEWV